MAPLKERKPKADNAASGVHALVEAVSEHKKFKQLACYSIDTISKNIGPPNTYWRGALAQARDCRAEATVLDVMKLHKGHENVLVVSVECLKRLACDAKCAENIVEAGGMDTVLESALANPDLPPETLAMCLELLEVGTTTINTNCFVVFLLPFRPAAVPYARATPPSPTRAA